MIKYNTTIVIQFGFYALLIFSAIIIVYLAH